jgi:hypothetical protein
VGGGGGYSSKLMAEPSGPRHPPPERQAVLAELPISSMRITMLWRANWTPR